MSDLYDTVSDRIIKFCDKTYYSDIVVSFEQSYDGKEWTKEVEFVTFYNGTDLCYENDWNEGQTYLRNLRIWHLEDSEPVIHCKDCKWYREKQGFCVFLVGRGDLSPKDYCSFGEHKDEMEE